MITTSDRFTVDSMTSLALSRGEQLFSVTGKPRRYPCPHCGKTFPNNYEVKRHYMIHTGIKPHKCQFCDRSFRQRPHLKAHISIHHPEHLIHEKFTFGNQ